jgi:cytochrome c peroxidase
MLRAIAPIVLSAAAVVAQTNFPPPPQPAGNPSTPAKELLGMALFFEEQLSSTNTVACATCHDFTHGGADPRTNTAINAGADQLTGTADDQRGSPGIPLIWSNGELLPHPSHVFKPNVTARRAPTVVNTGYHQHLMYDGSKANLEELAAAPLFNPVEMGRAGRTWSEITSKLATAKPLALASNLPQRLQTFLGSNNYPALFQQAFGTTQITSANIPQAIAAYIRTLNSDRSKWDLVQNGQATLTAQEQLGLTLFNAPANGATSCNTCHGDFDARTLTEGPVAGQMTMTTSGPYGSFFPTRLEFHNVGVRPPSEDVGRGGVTLTAADQGKFRVASLRNVALSAPYFHNGGMATLGDVVEFYNRGGDFHVNQAANLFPRNYTVVEKDAIVALLNTLTDPRLVAGTQPFDRPTLGSQNGNIVTATGAGQTTAVGELVATAPYAPVLGEQLFRITLSGAAPGSLTWLMWDTVAAAPNTLPFNLQLGLSPEFQVFGMGPVQTNWIVPGVGMQQIPMPLPNQPVLAGAELYAQWLVLDATSANPILTSNGLRIELQ